MLIIPHPVLPNIHIVVLLGSPAALPWLNGYHKCSYQTSLTQQTTCIRNVPSQQGESRQQPAHRQLHIYSLHAPVSSTAGVTQQSEGMSIQLQVFASVPGWSVCGHWHCSPTPFGTLHRGVLIMILWLSICLLPPLTLKIMLASLIGIACFGQQVKPLQGGELFLRALEGVVQPWVNKVWD